MEDHSDLREKSFGILSTHRMGHRLTAYIQELATRHARLRVNPGKLKLVVFGLEIKFFLLAQTET